MQTIVKGGWTYRVGSRNEQRVSALKDLAQYIRNNATFFVRSGPKMLTPSESHTRQQRINELAVEIDKLASTVPQGTVTYNDLEKILLQLQELGLYPDNALVSNAARAFV